MGAMQQVIEEILHAIMRALPSLSGDMLLLLRDGVTAETERRIAADAAHAAAQQAVDRALG